jgi:hypothetical protein
MRAVLVLLLLLAAVVFASYYSSALRPYWEGRLPQVIACLREGEFREAASAMVHERSVTPPPPSMTVTPSPASPDTSESSAPNSSHRQ